MRELSFARSIAQEFAVRMDQTLLSAVEKTRNEILDWLVEAGFGFDFWVQETAPFTRAQMAEAWHRHDPTESAETWEWALGLETPQRYQGDPDV